MSCRSVDTSLSRSERTAREEEHTLPGACGNGCAVGGDAQARKNLTNQAFGVAKRTADAGSEIRVTVCEMVGPPGLEPGTSRL